jgi:cytochrome c oxidase assembly protein subunit 11
VVVMLGMADAAIPLYRAFCQATGWNGTGRRGEIAAFKPVDRKIVVRFDTNVNGLPWDFSAEQETVTAQLGKSAIAYFKVRNKAKVPLTGHAVYNIYPESAAVHFIKTQCFCFTDQTIGAGQEMTFPVIFYVEPQFDKDPSAKNLSEITLSYTFYKAAGSTPVPADSLKVKASPNPQ